MSAPTSHYPIALIPYSKDLWWRAVALLHVYNIPLHESVLLGSKLRTTRPLYSLYRSDGVVNGNQEQKEKRTR
ncbi:hypothetical protein GN244_ATG04448 [Phytophthora infestans]|uniref:Uncharacterized protein n=1 Tax=Phytophthora infestans TaxID=4787 RepID=A0A833T6G8_PHYIN|nr:hypothetical protein GN244_ATG04448 [Phytophthora infestans]